MDPERVTWRKSSRSGNSGNCVEVADLRDNRKVALRDSKNPGGAKLVIAGPHWKTFLGEVKTGRFDLV